MHLSGLDLNLLMVLHNLFAEGSVTRTGERIHLSQSATSAALSRLREFFGDELFVPVGRKMVPTPLALQLVEPVRDLVLRAESISQHNTGFDAATYAQTVDLALSSGR